MKKPKIKSLKQIRLYKDYKKADMARMLEMSPPLYEYNEKMAQGYGPRVLIKLSELLGSDKKLMDFIRKYDR